MLSRVRAASLRAQRSTCGAANSNAARSAPITSSSASAEPKLNGKSKGLTAPGNRKSLYSQDGPTGPAPAMTLH